MISKRDKPEYSILTEIGPQPYGLIYEDNMTNLINTVDSLPTLALSLSESMLSLSRSSLCHADVYLSVSHTHPDDIEYLREMLRLSDYILIDNVVTKGKILFCIEGLSEWELMVRSPMLAVLLTDPTKETIITGTTLMTNSLDVLRHMSSYQRTGTSEIIGQSWNDFVAQAHLNSLNYRHDNTDPLANFHPMFAENRSLGFTDMVSVLNAHHPAYLMTDGLPLYNPNLSFDVFFKTKRMEFNIYKLLSATFNLGPSVQYFRNPVMVTVLKNKIEEFLYYAQWLQRIMPNNPRFDDFVFFKLGFKEALAQWNSIKTSSLRTAINKEASTRAILPVISDDRDLVEYSRYDLRSAIRMYYIPGLHDITQNLVAFLDNYIKNLSVDTLDYYLGSGR